MTKRLFTATTLAAIGLSASAMSAQPRQQQATAPPPPQTTVAPVQGAGAGPQATPTRPVATDPAKLATVQDALEGLELTQADKFLQLDDQQFADFIQRLRNLQRLRRQHQSQRNRLVGELRRLTNPQMQPPVEDALLEAPTKALADFDKQALQETQAAYAQIDEILTVRQRARFRVFEDQMEQRKLEILTRVLKAGAPPPGK